MPSGEVSVWVPIIVALFGFIGVLTSQVIAAKRDDKRWQRERDREDLRWQRQRDRERENRTHEARADSYAEVIGAIEAFDWALYRARKVCEAGQRLDGHLDGELRAATTSAGTSLGAANLHAPESIRSVLRESMLPRSRLATRLLDGAYQHEDKQLWVDGKREYQALRAAMRLDLGLDAEPEAA